MDLMLFLIGFVGFTVFLVMLIVNVIKKKEKRNALIGLAVCFVMMIVGLAMPTSGDSTDVAEEPENIEETAAETVPEETKEIEEESQKVDEQEDIEKLRETYKSEVKPWYDQIVKEYDDSWESLWQGTFDGISNNSIGVSEAQENLNELRDNRLEPLKNQINSFTIPDNFDETEKEEIENFKENMILATDARVSAVTEVLSALDGTIELDTDIIQETIERGDGYMLEGITSIVGLEQKLGLLEEEK